MRSFQNPYVVVVAGGSRAGTCRFCKVPIVWVTTASSAGHPSRSLPFDRRATPVHVEKNEETGVVFEWWPRMDLHLNTCRCRTKAPECQERSWQPA